MHVLISDPLPAEVETFLERRRKLGLDHKDEVWEGVLHVVPVGSGEHASLGAQVKALLREPAAVSGLIVTDEFNLGDSKQSFRVPDGGLHRGSPHGVWIATAALVLEVLSPDDETWEKLPFYAAHDVDEILIVDPDVREVHWLGLADGKYQPLAHSSLIDLGPDALAKQIDWP